MIENKGEGIRLNEGKVRHDLLEPYAIDELAKVFTFGADKYAVHNWLKGMNWSKVLASLKRHINKFEKGEDFDEETGLYHMAHAAWNALALVSYYKHFPQGDDRMYLIVKKPRISVDIDDVCADFIGEYCKLYDLKEPTSYYFDPLMQERLQRMHDNNTLNDFSLQLPELIKGSDLPFDPVAYVTARGQRSKAVTEEWLKLKGFPDAPVYCTDHKSKVGILKEIGVDIHVDDSYKTFLECNSNGICCYLFDACHNRKFNVGAKRIYSLKELA